MKRLTKQETKVSELIAFGFSEKEIAQELFIEESTAHTHARNIRRKIEARSAVDVARFYILKNPLKFFLSVFFIALQCLTITIETEEYRSPKTAKSVRSKRTFKARRYEVA